MIHPNLVENQKEGIDENVERDFDFLIDQNNEQMIVVKSYYNFFYR
jgi:hypothetical protein